MEDYPQLIMKWQEKRNQNVKNIVVEENENQPRIAVVTCREPRTGVDVTKQGIRPDQWVKKVAESSLMFDPRKERDTYMKAKKELLDTK
jgi:hypothetical protein